METAHHALETILNLFDAPQFVRDRAKLNFKRALEIKPSQEDYDALAIACVHRAHYDLQMWISFEEVERITGVPATILNTNFQIVDKILLLWHHQDFMKDFCNALDLPPAIRATAVKTYMKAAYLELNFILDFDADAIAAAIVYKTFQFSESPKTMLEIGEVVSVSEGDMLEAYEKILLLPNYL